MPLGASRCLKVPPSGALFNFKSFNFRLIWQTCENGVIKSFVNGLEKTKPLEVVASQASKEKLDKLVDTLKNTRGTHDFWACK